MTQLSAFTLSFSQASSLETYLCKKKIVVIVIAIIITIFEHIYCMHFLSFDFTNFMLHIYMCVYIYIYIYIYHSSIILPYYGRKPYYKKFYIIL